MALEGMWTVDFETASGVRNGGVIVLTGGRILGGDSGMYYVGTYSTVGSTMEGEVQITRYMGQPGMTAWGDDAQAFKLKLRGAANGKEIDGKVARVGYSDLKFHMLKRAELP